MTCDIASVSSQIIECQRRVNPGMDVNEAEAQVIRIEQKMMSNFVPNTFSS